jgi:alpha-glucosidase/alpha-D-xyloside xylohydrolase
MDTASRGLSDLVIGGQRAELQLAAVSAHTLRVTLLPVAPDGSVRAPADAPELAIGPMGPSLANIRTLSAPRVVDWNGGRIRVTPDPLAIALIDAAGHPCQHLKIDRSGAVRFATGSAPIFGLGQGGQQFDRRGGSFPLVNGQGEGVQSVDMRQPGARAPVYEFDLAHEGARVTIPWIVSTEGWGVFFRRPYGAFDLGDEEGRLIPDASDVTSLLDAFFVVTRDPAQLMREYAVITGFPHLPPLWSLGYMQSHRTLEGRDQILDEAQEFRRRALPCDAFIYLGTGFTTGGWNTGHGQFRFNESLFPDASAMIRQLHDDHIRVVLHVVDPPLHLSGTIDDSGSAASHEDNAAHYWNEHQPVSRAGVDGWWPDVGDKLDPAARLARIRMYWDGPIRDHSDRRPFALHRNGYAGMQRYGWLWSGDIDSTWQTLATQVPVGINCGLTGIPYWGTDIGGFITTPELTGELFVRWFQFGAFCPLFRAHGRTWKLRLPWGWNTGEYGPEEYDGRRLVPGTLPDRSELRNADVEPICKAYLELRYRLLPYLYSAVRETHETGMPVMRALWLHYPTDPRAVARGDEYLWGHDILVAPVVEKGAASRTLYLPQGTWYDFWTESAIAGGDEIRRPVDLKTMPLYVRAGAIIPTGPVQQHTAQAPVGPLTLTVYPGADGSAAVYEDDGISFAYQAGKHRQISAIWHDREKRLVLKLDPGSNSTALAPLARAIAIRVATTGATRETVFNGTDQTFSF